jgi:hypothetical protein
MTKDDGSDLFVPVGKICAYAAMNSENTCVGSFRKLWKASRQRAPKHKTSKKDDTAKDS